ncbi:hypothetical protein WJR50_04035 [Catalinimonas sp. 4WD22]|uniref:hypothetical protein n=1 Tax=Catalinimonas locisalis TaxID=3133978 RepID=UPI003100EA4D
MKSFLSSLVLTLIQFSAHAQADPGVESSLFRIEKGTFDSHQLMIGRKLPPPDVQGTYYLNEAWQQGKFVLKDGRKSATYPLRYDVENALLEIDWKGQTKVVGEELLSSFVWESIKGEKREYIAAQQFSYDQAALSGFVELIYSGQDSLLLKTETYLKAPTYVEGLDMGKRSAEILKRERYFVCQDGKLTEIKRRRDIINSVEPAARKAIRDFMKASHVQIDSREGLRSTWQFYESEVKN